MSFLDTIRNDFHVHRIHKEALLSYCATGTLGIQANFIMSLVIAPYAAAPDLKSNQDSLPSDSFIMSGLQQSVSASIDNICNLRQAPHAHDALTECSHVYRLDEFGFQPAGIMVIAWGIDMTARLAKATRQPARFSFNQCLPLYQLGYVAWALRYYVHHNVN